MRILHGLARFDFEPHGSSENFCSLASADLRGTWTLIVGIGFTVLVAAVALAFSFGIGCTVLSLLREFLAPLDQILAQILAQIEQQHPALMLVLYIGLGSTLWLLGVKAHTQMTNIKCRTRH